MNNAMNDESTQTGETLSPEVWAETARRMSIVFPHIAEHLKQYDIDGQGQGDADEFMNDSQLAIIALQYVAQFAADKCRFILL